MKLPCVVSRAKPTVAMALLDFYAAEAAQPVSIKDIAGTAGITEASVRGQLAGLTITLRNSKNGFT